MDKRTQILMAAEIVLTQSGFYAFSMQHLAKTADVAAGTIYRYFANKEVLMNELQQFIITNSAEIVLSGWDSCTTEEEKYNLIWQNIFDCVLANPRRLTLIDILRFVPNSEIALFEDKAFKPIIDFYQQGINDKKLLNWQLFALITASLETSISLAKQVIDGRIVPEQKQLVQVRDASWKIIQNPHFNQQD